MNNLAGGRCLIAGIELAPDRVGSPRDRRRRARARIGLGVHIRGGLGTLEGFNDYAKSLDVSRDGVLISTARGGYWAGQSLEVTCPFWRAPTGINTSRKAKVIRSILTSTFRYAVAVEFERPYDETNSGPWAVTPYVDQVRVLGVESDPRIALAMKGVLEQDGYHVLYVATPQQALDVLRSETPSVLVTEAEGGEISGLDLCAIVKTTERLKHIPIIVLTSSAMPSDYSAGHHLGAIVCMMKPCLAARLQRAVHMVAPPPCEQTVYSGRFNLGPFVRTS
jgi:CheY-like chemotaxis protein